MSHLKADGSTCPGRPGQNPAKQMQLTCNICGMVGIKPPVVNRPQSRPLVASFQHAAAMMAQRSAEAAYAESQATPEQVGACAGDASKLPNLVTKPFAEPQKLIPAVAASMDGAMAALERGRGNRMTSPVDVIHASILRVQMQEAARIAEAEADALRLAAATARLAASANTISELPTAAS
jgi:hypothetical protein